MHHHIIQMTQVTSDKNLNNFGTIILHYFSCSFTWYDPFSFAVLALKTNLALLKLEHAVIFKQ